MMKPTIGRQVWFWKTMPTSELDQPEAATVTYVWNDRLVNLHVLSHNAVPGARLSVPLIQEGDTKPYAMYCEWMPFQKGQARAQELGVAGASGFMGVAPGAAG